MVKNISMLALKVRFAMNNRSEHGILSSMNIEKITNNFITLYSFDMFKNKNTARIKVADITIEG